jgi:hypothetical protein
VVKDAEHDRVQLGAPVRRGVLLAVDQVTLQ